MLTHNELYCTNVHDTTRLGPLCLICEEVENVEMLRFDLMFAGNSGSDESGRGISRSKEESLRATPGRYKLLLILLLIHFILKEL